MHAEKIYPACYGICDMLQINTQTYSLAILYHFVSFLYHFCITLYHSKFAVNTLSPHQDINKDADQYWFQSQALQHISSSLSPAGLCVTYHNDLSAAHFLVHLILHSVNILLVCRWGCYRGQKALLKSI